MAHLRSRTVFYEVIKYLLSRGVLLRFRCKRKELTAPELFQLASGFEDDLS